MKTLNTVENEADARLARRVEIWMDLIPALLMLAATVAIVLSVTGCATGPFQARKQAWARSNCRTYGWEPVYLSAGETRYVPTALSRQVKSADAVAMQVATGQMRSISEAELPAVVDGGGAWWAKALDTSLAAIATGAATWGAVQLAQGINNDNESHDSSTRVTVTGDANSVQIQGGNNNNNSANRDNIMLPPEEAPSEPAPVTP